MSTRDLLEQRANTVQAMRALTDHPGGDDGDLSEAQSADFDAHRTKLENLEARLARQQLLDDAERRLAAPTIIKGNGTDGRFEERARSFSLVKAINAALGEDVDAGFEKEISAEVRSRSGRSRPFQGIAVPSQYFEVERRVLTVTGAGAANDLYPTIHRPDLFIDLLRSSLLVGRLGATILDGLVGDQHIPRQTGTTTAAWLAEDAALSPTDPAFDDVTLTPKTVGVVTSYSRKTLLNAQPSIERLLRADLANVIARAIDAGALYGPGTGDQPLGVANQPGIVTATLVGPTWAQVLAVIATIQSVDADVGSLGWAIHPKGVAKLRGTTVVATTGESMLMAEPGSLAGYPVVTSTAMPTAGGPPATSTTVLFGAWSQLLVGYWSGLDLLLNPYDSVGYLRGRVMLRAMQDVAVGVRHVESFVKSTNLPV
jgi:HK97 family phage major capsid protein